MNILIEKDRKRQIQIKRVEMNAFEKAKKWTEDKSL